MTKQRRGQEKEREDGCEKKSHRWVRSIITLTEFQPTPIPSNPQHNPERPTRPREPDPHHHNGQMRDSERERVRLGGVRDERKPNPTKEPDHHSQRTERDSERGEKVMRGVRTREDPTSKGGTKPLQESFRLHF